MNEINLTDDIVTKKKRTKVGMYIPFSGGFDSAYSILTLLDSISKEDDSIYDFTINLLSINASCTYPKKMREPLAREQLLSYFKTEYPNVSIRHEEVSIDTSKFHTWGAGMKLHQFYAVMMALNVDVSLYDKVRIELSYICGDQIAAYQREIEEIILNALVIANVTKTRKDIEDNVRIVFPHVTKYKEDILIDFIKRDMKHTEYGMHLMDICSTCEGIDMTNDNCGTCNPCKCLKSALLNIYNNFITRDLNDEIRLVALDIYKKRFATSPIREKLFIDNQKKLEEIATPLGRHPMRKTYQI